MKSLPLALMLALVVSFLPSTGTAQFRNPTNLTRVTSHVTHSSGGRLVRFDCTPISRAGHRGTDYGIPIGTPVYAAAAGTVIVSSDGCPANGYRGSRCGGGFGNYVAISHDNGMTTYYAHMSPNSGLPANGARVACGQQIGLSGNSGSSTGPHLHFEIRNTANTAVRPDPYGGACSSQAASLWTGGSPTASCTAGPSDNAQLTAATYPRAVAGVAGATVRQRLTFRNSGSTTWNSSYRLIHTSGAFSEVGPIAVSGSVAPGASFSFDVVVRTPSAAGTHRGQWRVANGSTAFGATGTLTINMGGGDPRGCSSSTLGRTVAHGSCVQVNYAGCGMSSCAWFRCADGGWSCTQQSDCPDAANTFASARCGGMPTTRDAGPVDAMMCTNPLQTSCSTDTQCCDALCAPRNGTLQCCLGAAQRCTSSMDCCGQTLCIGGRCALTARGRSCERTAECAMGGVCRRPGRGAVCELGQRDCTCQ